MPGRRPSPSTWSPTPRQRLVLHAFVLHGRKEAAHRLERSPATVTNTIRRMRERADVASIEQLIYVGAASGWLSIPDLERRPRSRTGRAPRV